MSTNHCHVMFSVSCICCGQIQQAPPLPTFSLSLPVCAFVPLSLSHSLHTQTKTSLFFLPSPLLPSPPPLFSSPLLLPHLPPPLLLLTARKVRATGFIKTVSPCRVAASRVLRQSAWGTSFLFCTHKHTHTCTHAHNTNTRACAHACMHAHTHTHTHTHIVNELSLLTSFESNEHGVIDKF